MEGAEGERGEIGASGPLGPRGSTGPQGLRGPTGPKGDSVSFSRKNCNARVVLLDL